MSFTLMLFSMHRYLMRVFDNLDAQKRTSCVLHVIQRPCKVYPLSAYFLFINAKLHTFIQHLDDFHNGCLLSFAYFIYKYVIRLIVVFYPCFYFSIGCRSLVRHIFYKPKGYINYAWFLPVTHPLKQVSK